MSIQGWRNGRIRGDAYDHFVDKYYPPLFRHGIYPRSLLGLFS